MKHLQTLVIIDQVDLVVQVQRVEVEKECLESHEGYSVSVHPRPFVRVAGNNNFAEGITDVAQRVGLLLPLLGIGDGKRRLYVYAFGCLVDHKIDFACYLGSSSVYHGVCGDPIIKWQSSGSLVPFLTQAEIPGPKLMFGTKCPSMMSR